MLDKPFYLPEFGKLECIETECGQIAVWDVDSEMGFRCTCCFAMMGSIGMPTDCKKLYSIAQLADKLKGE